jgi:POT family proton-dependent oligopeptide transporter
VASLTSVDTIGGQAIDRGAAFAQYLDVYGTAGWVTIGIGVGLVALSPLLNRLAHGVR